MSRLVDPTLCPDCRALLDPAATCTACGLEVTGPLAAELWTRMVAADGVVEQLRALSGRASATAPASVLASAHAARTEPSSELPAFPRREPTPPATRRLPAASVPVVLLSLGALCLLVAAAVFVAVAWSALGLTGRTLVLLGVTALLSLVAVVLTRRNLRGAAETFWVIVAGMLTVDLLGAQSAGLAGLDALDWRGTGALVGVALFALGLGVGAWALAQPVGRLYAAEAVTVTGALVVSVTNVWLAENPAVACTIAVPVLAGMFLALRPLLPVAAYGVGALSLASWLVLFLNGWDRALETATLGDWWSDLRGWPLLAAAVLAAVATHLPKVPELARPIAAGLALFALTLLADAPATIGTPTRDLLVMTAVLLVLALVAAAAPRVWALAAAVLAGLGAAGLSLVLAVAPWDELTRLDTTGDGPIDVRLVNDADGPAAWTALLLGMALAATLVLLLRRVPESRRQLAVPCVRTLAPALIALGALVMVFGLEPALWGAVLTGAVATVVAGGAAWLVRDHQVAGWVGAAATAYLVLLTLAAATANDLLLAISSSALAIGLAAVFAPRERSGSTVSAAVSGALAAGAGALALVAWAVWFGADDDATSVAMAVYAALVGLLAAPATRRTTSRVTFEVSAVVIATMAVTFAPTETNTAMVLTIVGSAAALVSVLNRDRVHVGWAAALVLGVATVIRVVEEVQFPEGYTLPAALLLVAAGVWRLHVDPDVNSFTVLGSGLTLGLLPSLLLALDEPLTLRGALIGAAGVLVLAAGVQLRLAAPFVLGAATTGLLALRHLQPYADAVPRWISLGGVGLALLVVGITWEARRRNLETAGRYLTALR